MCALEEALKAPTPGAEKAVGDTCNVMVARDELWRRALLVLAAHSERLESMAAGQKPAQTGQLEAALTGVDGPDFVDLGSDEQPARDAVAKLVEQMGTRAEKNDLGKAVQDAAPHVKTLCDGLDAYLAEQVNKAGEIQSELDKKRTTRTDRRCGMLDNRAVCVSESVLDRVVYSSTFGELASIESRHIDTRNHVAAFCAAHRKLEEAAASGTLKKAETYDGVVEAVKAAPRVRSTRKSGTSAAPADAAGKPAPATEPKSAPAK